MSKNFKLKIRFSLDLSIKKLNKSQAWEWIIIQEPYEDHLHIIRKNNFFYSLPNNKALETQKENKPKKSDRRRWRIRKQNKQTKNRQGGRGVAAEFRKGGCRGGKGEGDLGKEEKERKKMHRMRWRDEGGKKTKEVALKKEIKQ